MVTGESTEKRGKGRKEGRRDPYKFTPEKQKEYLKLLVDGGRRHASAYKIGVTPALIVAVRKRDQEFAKAMDLAERVANEHIESAMYQSAINGNVTAQQVWLYNRMPDKWKDARNRDGGQEVGNTYNYNFYMPDNQRTTEPINITSKHVETELSTEDQAILVIPDNGHINTETGE